MPQYRIEYFKEGKSAGLTLWAGSLEESKPVVRAGLIRHHADFARLIDVDGSNAEVWSCRSDVPET
jgi:hypothetical protein